MLVHNYTFDKYFVTFQLTQHYTVGVIPYRRLQILTIVPSFMIVQSRLEDLGLIYTNVNTLNYSTKSLVVVLYLVMSNVAVDSYHKVHVSFSF